MTMIDLRQSLNIVREEQYGVWFERWYQNTDVPALCRQAAEKGQFRLVIYDRNELLRKHSDRTAGRGQYLVSRFEDELFVPNLAKKLPSLSVYRKKWVTTSSFFGLGSQTTNYNQVIIDWSEADGQD